MLEVYQRGFAPAGENNSAEGLEVGPGYRDLPFDEDPLRRQVALILSRAARQGAKGAVMEISAPPERAEHEAVSRAVVSEVRRRGLLGEVPGSVYLLVDEQEGCGLFIEAAGRKDIVCLGDSITYGFPYGTEWSWTSIISEKLGRNMINRGINGDTTDGMLYRFDRHVASCRPSHAVVMGGINDALMGSGAGEILDNIEKIVYRCFEKGICPIIGITTPLIGDLIDYTGRNAMAALEELRQGLRLLASKKEIPVIDFFSALAGPDGTTDESLFVDGGHPNREGYRRMALVAEKALSRLE